MAETRAGLADSGAVMGRHIDAAGTPGTSAAPLSSPAWPEASPGSSRPSSRAAQRPILLWLGGALVTVALFGLGMLLVKSDVLLLRIFVALALPTLVWAVVALLRDSSVSTTLVDVAFGGSVALVSAVQLVRRTEPRRSTL